MELARNLNAALGTTHITPWNVDEIPEIWLVRIVKMLNLRNSMAEKGLIKDA